MGQNYIGVFSWWTPNPPPRPALLYSKIGVCIIFSYFCSKHRLWVLIYVLSRNMKKISEILSEKFQFLEVKFSIYLIRRVFVTGGRRGDLSSSSPSPPPPPHPRKKKKEKINNIQLRNICESCFSIKIFQFVFFSYTLSNLLLLILNSVLLLN